MKTVPLVDAAVEVGVLELAQGRCREREEAADQQKLLEAQFELRGHVAGCGGRACEYAIDEPAFDIHGLGCLHEGVRQAVGAGVDAGNDPGRRETTVRDVQMERRVHLTARMPASQRVFCAR